MSRNANSRFAINPTDIDISRSTFDRNCSIKTSFNVGDIIPFYVDEVLPGDTHQIDTSKVVRLQTLITPMMDNLYLDTYYFFVPNRLVWEHWKQFNGENTESAWIPQVEYSIPQITAPTGGWNVGTIADYMGIPTGVDGISINALPFRAYAMVCNDWFRDQNLCDPLNVPVDDTTVVGVNTSDYPTDVALGGMPFKAASKIIMILSSFKRQTQIWSTNRSSLKISKPDISITIRPVNRISQIFIPKPIIINHTESSIWKSIKCKLII